jgi:hypothetical protein
MVPLSRLAMSQEVSHGLLSSYCELDATVVARRKTGRGSAELIGGRMAAMWRFKVYAHA